MAILFNWFLPSVYDRKKASIRLWIRIIGSVKRMG